MATDADEADLTALADAADISREQILARFAWAAHLSADERDAFAAELREVARSTADSGDTTRTAIVLHGWRATAEALAAGVPRDGSDHDWLAEPIDVPRPE